MVGCRIPHLLGSFLEYAYCRYGTFIQSDREENKETEKELEQLNAKIQKQNLRSV